MKKNHSIAFTALILLLMPFAHSAQTPNLGLNVAGFVLFTATGAFDNAEASQIRGDIGTNIGSISGFPPGTLVGQMHTADVTSSLAATDVGIGYAQLAGLTCGAVIGTTLGNGQTLTPNVYCTGAASTLNGILAFDAQGDPNAVFVVQINGAFSTGSSAYIALVNGAYAGNIFWQINGAVILAQGTAFGGNIVCNGAITLLEGASLQGRALSTQGAISLQNNVVSLPTPLLPLPITLLSFNAEINSAKTAVNLSWQTASELNSAYFSVERSADGANFTRIGDLDAAGNSNHLLSYGFTDEKPGPGTNYYRLNQFDLDKSHRYSEKKAVSFRSDQMAISIFPNPFSTSLTVLNSNVTQEDNLRLIICNTLGEEMANTSISGESTTLETSNFPVGIYTYKVLQNNSTLYSGKLVSQR